MGKPWSMIIPQVNTALYPADSDLVVDLGDIDFIIFDQLERTLYIDSRLQGIKLGDFSIKVFVKKSNGDDTPSSQGDQSDADDTVGDPLTISVSVKEEDFFKKDSSDGEVDESNFPQVPLPKNRIRTNFKPNGVLEIKFSQEVGWNMTVIDSLLVRSDKEVDKAYPWPLQRRDDLITLEYLETESTEDETDGET